MDDTAPDFGNGTPPKRYPNSRPRNAASLIIVDQTAGTLNFLMGQRSDKHVFMPGFYVFPGGRLERADFKNSLSINPFDQKHLASEQMPHLGAALLSCALRETAEETGIDVQQFAHHIRYVGRAITPPGQVRRYDTRFFLLLCNKDIVAPKQPKDNELSNVGWYEFKSLPEQRIHRITKLVFEAVKSRLLTDPKLQKDLQTPIHRFRYGKAVTEYE